MNSHFGWKEVKGRGCPIAGTIPRDVDRFLELPPLSAAYGISSGVQGRNSHSCRYFARRFDRVMNLASIPVRFLIDRNAAAFVPRREIACRRCTIKAVE